MSAVPAVSACAGGFLEGAALPFAGVAINVSSSHRIPSPWNGAITIFRTIFPCIGYLAHPFNKVELDLLDYSYPLTQNPIEEQGNRFFWLDGKRKTPPDKNNTEVLAACALLNHQDGGREVFCRRKLG